MRKYIYLTIISILCFTLGFLCYNSLENFALESFKNYNLSWRHMNTEFMHTLEFALICGISPILINLVWKETETEKNNSKGVSILLILLSVLVFVAIRYILIKSDLDSQKSLGFSTIINVEDLNLPQNILLGEIIGVVIVYFILKKRKLKSKNAYR